MTRFAYPEGCFHIEPTPAQPQVAHCYGFFVFHHLRGKGLAHDLKQKQMIVLRGLGYDYATCTVDSNNQAQMRVLLWAGWDLLAEFKNSKTGGVTELWGCAIKKDAA